MRQSPFVASRGAVRSGSAVATNTRLCGGDKYQGDDMPGKITRKDANDGHNLVAPQVEPQRTPGKSTQVGNSYVDHGPACAGLDGGSDCFLNDGQRNRLIQLYQGRVSAAQLAYTTALTDLRVDKLVEKDDDLSWVFELVIGLVSTHVTTALIKALGFLRDGKADNILWALKKADLQIDLQNPSAVTSIATAVSNVTDGQITSVVKAAVDQGKSGAKGAAKGVGSGKDDRTEQVAYLDKIKDDSAMVYQHLREDPPGYATDAALVAMFSGFDAMMGHTVGSYKAKLTEQVERYMKSFVRRIGLQRRGGKPEDSALTRIQHDPTNDENAALTEVKVCWVVHTRDHIPRLAYKTTLMRRQTTGWAIGRSPTEVVPENRLEGHGTPRYHNIEPELHGAAIARHIEMWKMPPEIVLVDDAMWPHFKPTSTDKKKDQVDPRQGDYPRNAEGPAK